MRTSWLAGSLLVAAVALAAGPSDRESCVNLSKLTLPNTTIIKAGFSPAGPNAPAPDHGLAPPRDPEVSDLPAFCRVLATIAPTSDSDIVVEIFLPISGWNGKFQAVGNGGWGIINYKAFNAALRRGYAAAATNTGHRGGGSASFALGYPEKLTDFAYRAVHEMTVTSKAIIAKFYGRGPRYSYWNGCSTGGRQGLKEAQLTLAELWRVLEPGGTMVFSVYHPDLAEAGKEANFELGGIEYRLGAIRYSVVDYLQMASIAGFREVEYFEYKADPELIQRVPSAAELLGRNTLFALRARKSGN